MVNPAGRLVNGWVSSTLMIVIPLLAPVAVSAVMLFCASACAWAPNKPDAMNTPSNRIMLPTALSIRFMVLLLREKEILNVPI